MEPLKQSHTPIGRTEIIPPYLAILSWLKKSSNQSGAKIVLPCFWVMMVSLRIPSKCGKMRTRITPNADTFFALIKVCFFKYGSSNTVVEEDCEIDNGFESLFMELKNKCDASVLMMMPAKLLNGGLFMKGLNLWGEKRFLEKVVRGVFRTLSLFHILHCVKSVHIWSSSGPHFPAFRLNTERYGASLYSVRIRENTDRKYSECGHFSRSVKGNFCKNRLRLKAVISFRKKDPSIDTVLNTSLVMKS